jgi:Kef-type K+ transport system membrane component KefB
MERAVLILLTLGGFFIAGLLADLLSRRTFLPRVTLLLLTGFLAGPAVLDLLPDFSEDWFPTLTKLALVMVGFLLGEKFTLSAFRERGRTVLWMSVGETLFASLFVMGVLLALGIRVEIAILLAGIAPASAPAATVDVVRETGAQGNFSETLLGIVAIDDAWGLLMFSILLSFAEVISGQSAGAGQALLKGVWEVGGAILVGAVLGIPLAYLTGRIEQGEPTQAEALGMVFLSGGLSVWLNVSYILAAMILGATVANLASHRERCFNAIEGIEWPFMILFFVLAGASLHLDALMQAGLLGTAYVFCRVAGLVVGARISGRFCHADKRIRNWMGIALMPQAGVALGMALIAGQHFPDFKESIITVVIGSTVVFELLGPIAMRRVLIHVGEVGKKKGQPE